MMDESVAKYYWDLDGGFSSMAWLLPGWLPLPSFRSVHKSSRRHLNPSPSSKFTREFTFKLHL